MSFVKFSVISVIFGVSGNSGESTWPKMYVICMIFELNTSFDINTSWDSEEESIQYHEQELLAEKTLSVTLNDISSRNEVRASRYLNLKNNST